MRDCCTVSREESSSEEGGDVVGLRFKRKLIS